MNNDRYKVLGAKCLRMSTTLVVKNDPRGSNVGFGTKKYVR